VLVLPINVLTLQRTVTKKKHQEESDRWLRKQLLVSWMRKK